MTKQEIIDKINTGIRGQGSMVDIGGVLADVLTGIVSDMLPVVDVTDLVAKGEITSKEYANVHFSPIWRYNGDYYFPAMYDKFPDIQVAQEASFDTITARVRFADFLNQDFVYSQLDGLNAIVAGEGSDGKFYILFREL